MQTVFRSRKFSVIRTDIPTSDGGTRSVDLIRHPGAVVVLPLLANGDIVLIRNFRYTLGRELWELPAGTLDREGESTIAAAARELEEETGYRAGALRAIGEIHPSPGVMDEVIHAFVATELVQVAQQLEPTERIVVASAPRDDALRMAYDGRMTDAKSVVTLVRWDWQSRNDQ
ncbi:MAG: NUDIX hydrolase [Phycisphaerae bacterium]|nr:NUDIX hydrolase [Phycisphaerae bacterium]